jgi:hypothetical protein
MKLSNYRSADLRKAIQLLQEREKLMGKLQNVEKELDAIGAKAAGRPNAGQRAPRGALKEAVIEALKTAGATGLSPKELAASLGVSGMQINAWLASTGKRVKEIKRVGRGKYYWAGK